MKTKTIILVAALTAAILVSAFAAAFLLFFSSFPLPSTLPSGKQPQAQFQVTGNVQQEKTWTLKELTEMPLTNVTTSINGENATYLGVPFYDLCNRTGMLWDVGPVEIIGQDGSTATINIFDAYNSSAYPYYYTKNIITLAFAKNGEWMTNETGGPLKLIAPYFPAETQVENVAEIHFKPWTISIVGDVANPLVITQANLTSFHSTTVYAEFAPSEKRWGNWTGLPILEVLEAANVSDRAEKISITAVDGYVKNYTLQQVEEGQMLIGYAENDCPLPHPDGGPYRVFAPTDKYKWAQFWVKFVVEIEVS